MNIKGKIDKLAKNFKPKDLKDLERKIAYSKNLLDKGILKRNNYDLPQIDTLGKSYYYDYQRNKVDE